MPGCLIVNADDWGRNIETTDRIAECAVAGGVSAVSAMVFMADSERAAAIARERGIEAGLHLNFTTPFTATGLSADLVRCQQAVGRSLRRHRLAPFVFHPGLMRSFEYLVAAQRDEFRRLYGAYPRRLDGHHHMHLCANVLLGRLMPAGTFVRRNFCFDAGEKSLVNRVYRRSVDRVLARRHRLTDLFFSLAPLDPPSRIERICSLASRLVVELETHPIERDEYRFLRGGELLRYLGGSRIVPTSAIHPQEPLTLAAS